MVIKFKKKAKSFKNDVFALYIALRKKDTPFIAKIIAGIIVAYVLSPIDLIPDFIPILGYLDDLLLVPLGLILVYKLIPPNIMSECREEAAKVEIVDTLEGKIGSIAILIVWIIVMGIIIYNIMAFLL
jgi:uncharacterized membrane protein YkvA (DUF1232 family)